MLPSDCACVNRVPFLRVVRARGSGFSGDLLWSPGLTVDSGWQGNFPLGDTQPVAAPLTGGARCLSSTILLPSAALQVRPVCAPPRSPLRALRHSLLFPHLARTSPLLTLWYVRACVSFILSASAPSPAAARPLPPPLALPRRVAAALLGEGRRAFFSLSAPFVRASFPYFSLARPPPCGARFLSRVALPAAHRLRRCPRRLSRRAGLLAPAC